MTNTTCQMTIDVPTTLHPPVLVMYTLGNAYINHARYINSISPLQLEGNLLLTQDKLFQCQQPRVSVLLS